MSQNTSITPIKLHRSALFKALTCGLFMSSISLSALAQTQSLQPVLTDTTPAQCTDAGSVSERAACINRRLGNFHFSLHNERLYADSMAATPTPTMGTDVLGKIGDPDSWVTEEFEQDWGLTAINAQYAYARGLTGSGIRIGLFDSGAGLEHPEFAGKNHQGLLIGDLLDDGTRCAADKYIAGSTACFGTDGGRPNINAYYFEPSLEPFIDPKYHYLLGKTQLSFGSHGTHVAGTMAANRDGSGMHGVAFGADFSSARLFADNLQFIDLSCLAFNFCSSASTYASISAFEDMYTQMNAANVRALNHSWGLGREPIDKDGQDAFYNNPANLSRWETIRDGSLAKGMIQVWAAGNTRSVIANVGEDSPIAGIYASLPRLFPELEQYWLAVVNVGQTGDPDNPYALSNRSMKCGLAMEWCLAAPGSDVFSSVYGGSSLEGGFEELDDGNYGLTGLDTLVPEFDYDSYSGTSMAAPHVTGALALLFERFPYLTNAQVRDVMLTTATDMGEEGVDEVYGWGLLNLRKAIEGYGQFRVDTDVVMVAKAGGVHVWNDPRVWDNWTNDIGGPGHFSFTSPNGGWLRLSGNNSFNGLTVKGGVLELTGNNTLANDVTVDGGLLMVNGAGTLNNTVTVNKKGTLGGTGTINGDVSVAGTIAPGASIGTLSINGDYLQKAGSYFIVEMQPPSKTDRLEVDGKATLQGGTVRAVRMPGVYILGQSYNFLNATGGIFGTFDKVDVSGLSPFLAMQLRYTSNSVFADMVRGAPLVSAAISYNQMQTAGALDSLPDDNALLQSLVLLPNEAAAKYAFDALSGELHSTARGILADDSRHVRNAALARARTGHDTFTAQSAAPGFAAWADLLSSGGALQGNSNAAYARYSGYHALVGGDYQFDSGLRIGVLGGIGRTDTNVGARGSKGEIRNNMVGIYGGHNWGGFGVYGGYVYTSHDIDSKRNVVFTGYANDLKGDYEGTTGQAFVEAGYEFAGANWQVEPYLQYANVKVDTDAFTEHGGDAALQAADGSSQLDIITGGVRFAFNLKGSQQEQTWLSLRGGLGYRQASGDITSANMLKFNGSSNFTIQGAPLAKNATVAELGLAARVTERTLFELGYNGQFASEGNDHGVNARLSVKF